MLGSKHHIVNRISKESILAKVTEEDIFEHYLGVPCVGKKFFCNPFREDKNPTCSFYFTHDGVIFRDWQGWYKGGCFGLVQKVHNCTFREALERILDDMRLDQRPATVTTVARVVTKKKEFRIKRREWAEYDIAFWAQFGITLETLEYFGVSPLYRVWMDDDLAYTDSSRKRGYAYHFVDYEYKLYFPGSERKFWTNCNRLQGFAQLTPSTICVITKSMKDVMTLYGLGVVAVAPASENALVSDKIVAYLKEHYTVMILFDNDATGLQWGRANAEHHNITDVYLPVEKAKDISDFRRDYGECETKLILQKLNLSL